MDLPNVGKIWFSMIDVYMFFRGQYKNVGPFWENIIVCAILRLQFSTEVSTYLNCS